jgi:hypothetical protein
MRYSTIDRCGRPVRLGLAAVAAAILMSSCTREQSQTDGAAAILQPNLDGADHHGIDNGGDPAHGGSNGMGGGSDHHSGM